MKNKTKIILSSILSIILCASLIAGATFALFTNQSEVNIAVTSGKVNVQASIGGLNTYSALVRPTADFSAYEQGEDDIDEEGMQLGEFAADYYHDKQEAGKFSVGGTAKVEENVLKLSKMVPGDKATATITLTNNSNVDIKCRLIIKCTSGLKLFSGLLFKVEGIGEESATTNVMSYASAWQTWELSAAKTQTLNVSVELPLDAGNEYQDLATNILFAIEAVQGNAATSDEAEIVYVPAVENAVVSKTAQQTVVAEQPTVIETPNTPVGSSVESEKTTVTFPANSLPQGEESTTSELTVETYAVEVSSVKFEVTDEGKDAYAGLELILKVNGEQVTDFGGQYVTIVTYIEPGLSNVDVKYNGEGLEQPKEVHYDDETGELRFQTNHFSEYYVIADTVAKIGDMPYISLASAIAAAEQGDEIVLVKDIAVSAPVDIAKQITLNLNGKTISEADGYAPIDTGLLAIRRGGDVTLTGNGKVISTKAYSAINITKRAIDSAPGDGENGEKAKLTVKSGEIIGLYYGIAGNGSRHDTSVTIDGGTIRQTVVNDGAGIFNPQNGELVINGGTIEGAVGVYVKAGNPITVNGGTIRGIGVEADFAHSDSGLYNTGDAFVVENCGYPGGVPQPDITGGTFISVNADAVASYAYGEGNNPIGKFISGGTFSSKPAQELLAIGYMASQNGENYVVSQCDHAKKVAVKNYWKLDEKEQYEFYEESVCPCGANLEPHKHDLSGMYCNTCKHMIPLVFDTLDLKNDRIQDQNILALADEMQSKNFNVLQIGGGTSSIDKNKLNINELNYLACFNAGDLVGLLNDTVEFIDNEDGTYSSSDNPDVSGRYIAEQFGNWCVDFTLTFNVDVDLRCLMLAGSYQDMYYAFKLAYADEQTNKISANTEVPVIKGATGGSITYDFLLNENVAFLCGLYIDVESAKTLMPSIAEELADATVTLKLVMYEKGDYENRTVVNTIVVPLSDILGSQN